MNFITRCCSNCHHNCLHYKTSTPLILSGKTSTSYVSAGNSLEYQPCTVPTETVAQPSFELNDRLTTGFANFSMTNISTPMPIDSISSDISIGVPDNIKEKNVKSDYIDIGSLLPNNMHIENSHKLTIYQGELVLQKNSKQSKYRQYRSVDVCLYSIYQYILQGTCKSLSRAVKVFTYS